jgi:hypothetical protein
MSGITTLVRGRVSLPPSGVLWCLSSDHKWAKMIFFGEDTRAKRIHLCWLLMIILNPFPWNHPVCLSSKRSVRRFKALYDIEVCNDTYTHVKTLKHAHRRDREHCITHYNLLLCVLLYRCAQTSVKDFLNMLGKRIFFRRRHKSEKDSFMLIVDDCLYFVVETTPLNQGTGSIFGVYPQWMMNPHLSILYHFPLIAISELRLFRISGTVPNVGV